MGQLKSVFQRGLGAFNTSHSPLVKSAEQWAYARVNAYLYLLKNGRPENPKYTTDYDLLPKGHPKEKMGKVKEGFPIPSPESDEEEEKYISRCVSSIIDEYGQEQAAAICYSKWREK